MRKKDSLFLPFWFRSFKALLRNCLEKNADAFDKLGFTGTRLDYVQSTLVTVTAKDLKMAVVKFAILFALATEANEIDFTGSRPVSRQPIAG